MPSGDTGKPNMPTLLLLVVTPVDSDAFESQDPPPEGATPARAVERDRSSSFGARECVCAVDAAEIESGVVWCLRGMGLVDSEDGLCGPLSSLQRVVLQFCCGHSGLASPDSNAFIEGKACMLVPVGGFARLV